MTTCSRPQHFVHLWYFASLIQRSHRLNNDKSSVMICSLARLVKLENVSIVFLQFITHPDSASRFASSVSQNFIKDKQNINTPKTCRWCRCPRLNFVKIHRPHEKHTTHASHAYHSLSLSRSRALILSLSSSRLHAFLAPPLSFSLSQHIKSKSQSNIGMLPFFFPRRP